MWLRIRSLIIKELLAVWRDPKGRFILLVPPVIEMVIFAYAATQEVKNVPIAILNQDLGTYGRDLAARFEGFDQLPRGALPWHRSGHRPGDRFAERAPGRAHRPGLFARRRRPTARVGAAAFSTAAAPTLPRSWPATPRKSSTATTPSWPRRARGRRRPAPS